jgi:ABC-type glutathione transport system ATPase component
MTSPDLLSVADLSIRFKTRNGEIEALRNLNLTVAKGEVLGIVGESGSGKSVTLRAILGLLPDSARISGRIVFDGNDLLSSDKRVYERIRGRDITFVSQNPADSFNPSLSVGYHLTRLLRLREEEHQSRQDRRAAVKHLLSRVKVDPAGALERYPFGFSQGQLQRIMVAMAALIGKPKLLLADEPTTSLDVTTEAQLISLIAEFWLY